MNAHSSHDVIASYEQLAQVTARMREAAVSDDWDKVIALQSECAGLYTRLMSAADERASDPTHARRKSELICKVLEHDAQIREKLSGQLVHIWRMLEGGQKVSRLNSAYGPASGADQ